MPASCLKVRDDKSFCIQLARHICEKHGYMPLQTYSAVLVHACTGHMPRAQKQHISCIVFARLIAAPTAARVVNICVCIGSIHLPREGQAAVRVGVATAALCNDTKLSSRFPTGHMGSLNLLISAIEGGPAKADEQLDGLGQQLHVHQLLYAWLLLCPKCSCCCSPARDPTPSWHVGFWSLGGDGNRGVEEVSEASGAVLLGVYVGRAVGLLQLAGCCCCIRYCCQHKKRAQCCVPHRHIRSYLLVGYTG